MSSTSVMTVMTSTLAGPTAEALAWTLVHFLWQGTALGLAAWLVMRHLTSASTRHIVGVAALATMLATTAGTFVWLARATPPVAASMAEAMTHVGALGVATAPVTTVAATSSSIGQTAGSIALPLVVVLWLSGVIVLSVRLAGGLFVVRRLAKRAVQPVDGALEDLARTVADRLALPYAVRLVQSSVVYAPVLIGWLRPVVLLPTAAIAGLAPLQLEALIAHELAHVKRHDYLVNLLQSAVETLLFYHPAVWWVSREIRREREHCCDDLAVAVCDRVVYASALSELAAIGPRVRFALGASDGPLFRRIRRILEGGTMHRTSSSWLAAPVVVLFVAALVPAGVALTREPGQTTASPVPRTEPAGVVRATAPAERATTPVRAVPTAPTEQAPATTVPIASATRSSTQLISLRNQLAEMDREFARLADERRQLEAARVQTEIAARRQTMESEIEALRAELSRLDTGTAGADTPVMLAQARRQLAVAEAELRSIEAEAEFRAKVAALDTKEAQQRFQHEFLTMQLAMAEQLAQEAQLKIQREVEAQAMVDAEKHLMAQRDAEARMNAQAHAEALLEVKTIAVPAVPPIAPAGATARAGDVLTIDIEGESALPRAYEVRADGTIQLPLVGPVSVQGLTNARIREVIAKELADRRLATGRRVTATLHRPR